MNVPNKHPEAPPNAIAYRIFRSADVNALMKEVTTALNNNWKLAGGVSVTTIDGFPLYAQAVFLEP